MNLMPRDILLIMIDHAGGQVQGRTLLQKRGYFLDELIKLNLGYRPYYYGPYSPRVDDALGDLKGLRFVEEREKGFNAVNEEGFQVRRFDYELTEDGKLILGLLGKRHPEDYQKIKKTLDRIQQAGEPDYITLSVAAKAHFILSRKGAPMTSPEIIDTARGLNWKISEPQLQEAAGFLGRLGMIKTA